MWQIEFQAPYADLNTLVAAFDEDSIQSISWKEERPMESWHVVVVFPRKPDLKYWQSYLERYCMTLGVNMPTLLMEPVPEKDWLQENQKIFAPFRVGSFYIYGSDYKGKIPHEVLPLQIDAATAFGSGQHETTKGCLLAFEYLKNVRHVTPSNAIDLGCGSGVLAMAAARLWAADVVAIDNDPEAASVAAQNVMLNQLSSHVLVEMGDAGRDSQARYQLIVANILAEPLRQLAPHISKLADEDSFLILSGLLNDQAESVLEAYRPFQWTLVKHDQISEWSTLILQK